MKPFVNGKISGKAIQIEIITMITLHIYNDVTVLILKDYFIHFN